MRETQRQQHGAHRKTTMVTAELSLARSLFVITLMTQELPTILPVVELRYSVTLRTLR